MFKICDGLFSGKEIVRHLYCPVLFASHLFLRVASFD